MPFPSLAQTSALCELPRGRRLRYTILNQCQCNHYRLHYFHYYIIIFSRGVYPPLGHGGTPPLSHRSNPPSEVFSQTPRLGGLGSIVSSPAGSGAEPQRPTHLEHLASGADPGIYFGGPNQGPQSKVMGEARIEGAKRPRIEGEAREKSGGRGLERGLGEPLPRKFLKN